MKRILALIPLKFIRFGVVGFLGYLVDVGVLQTALYLGLDAYTGQIIGFIAAASFTWIANRLWTFKDRNNDQTIVRQWLKYFVVMLVGFSINYTVYAALITWGGIWALHKFLAVAMGTLAGLCFNFPVANYAVFKSKDKFASNDRN